MVKLRRDVDKVHSKAIYAWSYHTTHSYRHCRAVTEKSFYKKKYCQIPFYSRVHAKHILTSLYGVDALRYVHFISGKELRAQGMKVFKQHILMKFTLANMVYRMRYMFNPEKGTKYVIYIGDH